MHKLKSLIKQYDVISFDIFDTLLFRPFMDPKDVFSYIAKSKSNIEFIKERVLAEYRARKEICNNDIQDITYDQIYQHINPEFREFYNYEKEFEKQILIPNKKMLKIFKYALEQKKKVIITSDMYFEEDFLTEVLNTKGFYGFDKLYVSSKYKKNKYSGELYKIICNDLGATPDKILHIGDNYKSDVISANKLGINTFHFEKIKEQFIKGPEHKRLIEFYLANEHDVLVSALLGLRIINWYNNEEYKINYWQNFGYNYGGLIIIAIIQAVIEIIKYRNITDVFFIARDGYPLLELFEKCNITKAKGHYIYASRKLRSLCVDDDYEYNTYDKTAACEYEKYINSIELNGDNILIVDSCANNYSAQCLIETYLSKKNILGVYLTAVNNYKYNYINLFIKDFKKVDFNWDIIELILTSPELQIIGIQNNKPVYINSDSENYGIEMRRSQIFKEVYIGETNFIKDFYKVFNGFEISQNFHLIYDYLTNFYDNLTDLDKSNLGTISHAEDPDHKKYTSLVKTSTQKNTKYNFASLRNNILKNKNIKNYQQSKLNKKMGVLNV